MNSDPNRATLNSIAQRAAVSVSTASRILNGPGAERFAKATRQKVQEAAAAMGYISPRAGRAAEPAATSAGRTLAYLYSSHLEVFRASHDERAAASNVMRGVDFYSQLIIGLQQAMLRNGMQMHLAEALDTPEAQIEFLRSAYPSRISGLLCSGMLFDQTVAYLREQRIPAVYIGGSDETRGQIPAICIDDSQCAFLATRHLTALGHERLAFVGNFRCDFTNFQRQRLGGFCQALLTAGLNVCQDLLFSTDFESPLQAEQLIEQILAMPQAPTGIVTATGLQAIAILNVLTRRGIEVPRAMSIIAVGNPLVADYTHPPLSGVHVPIVSMGAEAVRLLEQYMQQPDLPPVMHLMPGQLVIRRSTGPRPGAAATDLEQAPASARVAADGEPRPIEPV